MQPPEAAAFTLEPLAPRHADALYAVLADPALYRHIDEPAPASPEAFRERCRRLALGAPAGSGQVWINEVIVTEEGAAAGYVQSTVLPSAASAWIAYMLGTGFRGRGFATRAAAALMERLSRDHPIARWLATVEIDNTASIAVLERLGFRRAVGAELAGRELTPTERLYVRDQRGGK